MPEKAAFNISSNGIQKGGDSGINRNDKSSYSFRFNRNYKMVYNVL
jgi:hypothetical protein